MTIVVEKKQFDDNRVIADFDCVIETWKLHVWVIFKRSTNHSKVFN